MEILRYLSSNGKASVLVKSHFFSIGNEKGVFTSWFPNPLVRNCPVSSFKACKL